MPPSAPLPSDPPAGAAAPVLSYASPDPAAPAPPDVDGPAVMRRITWRLVPFLCLLYVVNYLDRTNISMAKLQMLRDLHLDDAAYGLGSGIFYVGYFLFEIPSNLLLERVGARRWIARIMLTWGVISTLMTFVKGAGAFYLLRFLLGFAEAGFFPGIVLYLTYWVPPRQRAKTMAAFLTSIALSGIIGNPLAGLLMKMEGLGMPGLGHLHGWQWVFLIEGLPPILLALAVLRWLPDGPHAAPWLSPAERDWVRAGIESGYAQVDAADAADAAGSPAHADTPVPTVTSGPSETRTLEYQPRHAPTQAGGHDLASLSARLGRRPAVVDVWHLLHAHHGPVRLHLLGADNGQGARARRAAAAPGARQASPPPSSRAWATCGWACSRQSPTPPPPSAWCWSAKAPTAPASAAGTSPAAPCSPPPP